MTNDRCIAKLMKWKLLPFVTLVFFTFFLPCTTRKLEKGQLLPHISAGQADRVEPRDFSSHGLLEELQKENKNQHDLGQEWTHIISQTQNKPTPSVPERKSLLKGKSFHLQLRERGRSELAIRFGVVNTCKSYGCNAEKYHLSQGLAKWNELLGDKLFNSCSKAGELRKVSLNMCM